MKDLNVKKPESKRHLVQARKQKRSFAFLNNKSGEGYVDVAVTVMIVAFVLVFAVNVVSLVALNQNLKTVSDQLTDYATLNGTVAVDSYAAELKKQTGIDFGYSFDGVSYTMQTAKYSLATGSSVPSPISFGCPASGILFSPSASRRRQADCRRSIGNEVRRLNHIKEALKDKNGDAYIWLCVIVVFISMLLSVLILYMGLLSQVQIQKRDVKTKLDSVVSEYATEMFDAIKHGAPSEQYIDYDGLVRKAYARLGFPSDTVTEYPYPNGNCVMMRPQVTSLKGDGFGITVRYTVVFPIKWNGNTYKSLEVPITVSSYYKCK